ncbi:MAG: alpha/beta fold hydrolase, partial [Bacteroidota bacterium]
MLHTTDSLRTPDGLTLFTRTWAPELGTVRADVLLVHGIGEHSGRYAHIAAHLMMQGIRVFAYDQRGHGESEGERAYIERFDSLVADLHHVRALVEVQRAEPAGPTTPLFLMGHSLGGLVAARYVSAHSSEGLAGVILSSPALRTDVAPLLQKVSGAVARFAPRLRTVKLDLKALSRDPRVIRNYEEDPLVTSGRGVRAR